MGARARREDGEEMELGSFRCKDRRNNKLGAVLGRRASWLPSSNPERILGVGLPVSEADRSALLDAKPCLLVR